MVVSTGGAVVPGCVVKATVVTPFVVVTAGIVVVPKQQQNQNAKSEEGNCRWENVCVQINLWY